MKRHLGFFAYSPEWVADYSNKVALLLAAENKTGLSAQPSFLTCYRNSQDASCLCRTQASPGKRLPRSTNRRVRNGYRSDTESWRRLCRFLLEDIETSKKRYSVVEREAMANLEGPRYFSDLLRTSRVLVRTNRKALPFIFLLNSSRVNNDKMIRGRLRLSGYNFNISYHRASKLCNLTLCFG